jgi:SAM-dependent methyltransferase
MPTAIKKNVLHGTNSLLGLADLKLVRSRDQDWSDPSTFLPLKETVAAAQAAGLPLGEYIENTFNVPGAIGTTIGHLTELDVFSGTRDRICEIGPGSARFLEPVRSLCKPSHYEVYETAAPWAKWLQENYGVILRATDGKSLKVTPDDSIDLVHAHKVLVVVPLLGICRYLKEMMRVTRPGGVVVFDAFTDDCLADGAIDKWLATDVDAGSYPSLVLKQLIVDLFTAGGFDLSGTFLIPMKPGTTQYFVFRRR